MSREVQQMQRRPRLDEQRSHGNRYDAQRRQSVSRERGVQRRQSVSREHDAQGRQSVSREHDAQGRQSVSRERGVQGRQSVSRERGVQRQQHESVRYDGHRQAVYGKAHSGKGSYEYQHGTAVREPSFEELLEEAPKRKPNHTARKNREKAVQMNLGYVAFLIGALAFAAVVLIGYINLQSDITNSVKRVSRMESELHALRQDNDEYETRINSSIDLEEVKRIAICELGMKYAAEGQIIRVEGGGDDYARKYADIPQE